MKKVCILMMLIFASVFTKAQNVVLTRGFGSGSVVLERKTEKRSFRQNGDGSRFYKTTYTLKVNSGNQQWSKEMPEIYSDKGTAMEPCMLIDEPNNLLYVFALSKSDEQMYGMDGIIFRLDMKSGQWTRENVFSKSNWGWFAYFGGTANGNPELWHFSYSGYRNMCSTRNNNGGWFSTEKGSLNPDQAANQRSCHDNILFIGSPNVQMTSWGGNDVNSNSSNSKSNNNNNEPIGPNNKYKNYQSLPDVGPIAGEFYVGLCNATPKPKDPPITGREMSVIWEFDVNKGMVGFSTPEPQGGGYAIVNYSKITFYLANGQQITNNSSQSSTYHKYNPNGTMVTMPTHASYYWIYLPDYNNDQIVVTSINVPEQSGQRNWDGYWTKYNDHVHKINYTLPINVKEAKAYYYFNKAKKSSLKDAINYVKGCTKDNYRTMVEDEIVNSKTGKVADIVYCNDNYPRLSDRLEDKMFGLINSVSDCEAYLKYYSASKHGSTIEDKMFGLINSVSDCEVFLKYYPSSKQKAAVEEKLFQYVISSGTINDCEAYLKAFPDGKHKSAVVAQKNECVCYNTAINGGKEDCSAYLKKFPNGRFTSEIQNRLELLSRPTDTSSSGGSGRQTKIVDESNVKDRISETKSYKSHDDLYYDVYFKSGQKGSIRYSSLYKHWQFCTSLGPESAFQSYSTAKHDTELGALVELYKAVHKYSKEYGYE